MSYASYWIFIAVIVLCLIDFLRIILSFRRTAQFIGDLRRRYERKIEAIKEQNKI